LLKSQKICYRGVYKGQTTHHSVGIGQGAVILLINTHTLFRPALRMLYVGTYNNQESWRDAFKVVAKSRGPPIARRPTDRSRFIVIVLGTICR